MSCIDSSPSVYSLSSYLASCEDSPPRTPSPFFPAAHTCVTDSDDFSDACYGGRTAVAKQPLADGWNAEDHPSRPVAPKSTQLTLSAAEGDAHTRRRRLSEILHRPRHSSPQPSPCRAELGRPNDVVHSRFCTLAAVYSDGARDTSLWYPTRSPPAPPPFPYDCTAESSDLTIVTYSDSPESDYAPSSSSGFRHWSMMSAPTWARRTSDSWEEADDFRRRRRRTLLPVLCCDIVVTVVILIDALAFGAQFDMEEYTFYVWQNIMQCFLAYELVVPGFRYPFHLTVACQDIN
ncbi:hypothetical protein C8Q80DRAFT_1152364 [Daedaleopsis nitida]|nr:hypothetical protein C8Q80DRAFT_1152364 [Daedaleopsis nitida]